MKLKKQTSKFNRVKGIFLILNVIASMFAFAAIIGTFNVGFVGGNGTDDCSIYDLTLEVGLYNDCIQRNELSPELAFGGGLANAPNPTTDAPVAKEPGGIAGALGIEGSYGYLVNDFFYAAAIAATVYSVGTFLGVDESAVDAATKAAFFGVLVNNALNSFVEQGIFPSFVTKAGVDLGFLGLGTVSIFTVALAVAILVFILTFKKTDTKIVEFSCLPWQAPTGGANCERCNDGNLPCSEYQCRSLGQACQIVNAGTQEEKCVWVNRQDVNPPTIEPYEDALLDNYKYSPDNTISPPDRGVKVLNTLSSDGCVPAFTPLRFGVKLDEPAKCKVDILRKNTFEEMGIFMSSGLLRYNHTFALSLPSPSSLSSENITLQNDGNFELYTRCEDANGNSNTGTFVFKYCVDKGPDTTPPLIVATSLINKMPVAFNKTSVNLDVYVNEPATCKWSHNNRDYESMEETMSCATSVFEYNAQMLYKCSTTLTGIKSQTENKFYFRCEDKPTSPENERNMNTESYEFSILGTRPLVIDSITPDNETIKDSTQSIKVKLNVKTSAGYQEGKAICYYSNTGNENSYIKFFKTDSYQHEQELFLVAGSYDYFIKCTDLGGNTDVETINFEVETDLSSPIIVRAYKEDNFLKLITSETASCVYSTFSCNYLFEEGTEMNTIGEVNHFTQWNPSNILHVKCQDEFGNQPNPDVCSIKVKPSDF
ncbi:hypothetical protein J4407_02935 [Candidatus Pacearchaeota archaeon]|nr:hypothetical protein [Candidatus Pacearchaeota archaeon]